MYEDESLEFVGALAQDVIPQITDILWNSWRLKRLKIHGAGLGVTPTSISDLSRPLAVNHVLVQVCKQLTAFHVHVCYLEEEFITRY